MKSTILIKKNKKIAIFFHYRASVQEHFQLKLLKEFYEILLNGNNGGNNTKKIHRFSHTEILHAKSTLDPKK